MVNHVNLSMMVPPTENHYRKRYPSLGLLVAAPPRPAEPAGPAAAPSAPQRWMLRVPHEVSTIKDQLWEPTSPASVGGLWWFMVTANRLLLDTNTAGHSRSSRCQPAFWWQMPAECEVYKDETNISSKRDSQPQGRKPEHIQLYAGQSNVERQLTWDGKDLKSWWTLSYCRFWVSRFRCQSCLLSNQNRYRPLSTTTSQYQPLSACIIKHYLRLSTALAITRHYWRSVFTFSSVEHHEHSLLSLINHYWPWVVISTKSIKCNWPCLSVKSH